MKSGLWVLFLFGIAQVAACLYVLPNGGSYRGFPVPAWGVAIQVVMGICISAFSLFFILRAKNKRSKSNYTEEEIAKSKVILEKMYLKQHGRLPEYSEEIKNAFGPDKDDRTKDA